MPLNSFQFYGAIVSFVLSLVSFVLNAFLLMVLMSSAKLRNHQNAFGIGQVLFDVLCSAVYLAECLSALISPQLMLENDLLCQAYGVAVSFFTSISLFSIFHIPLNPYLVLVLKKPTLSKRMTIICFCYMTLVSTLIAVWIYFSGDRYALSPNNAYCYLNLEHPTPGTIRALLINMFFYSSPLFVISYLYYHIYLALQRIKKDKQEQEVKQSTATGPDDRLLKLQIQIAWRGALVLLVFLVGYAYPIIYLVTRGLLRIDYHIMFDLFFAWSIISNLLFNPIVYYMTDPRVIGIAHEMLPFLPNTSFFEKNMSKSESELQPKRLRAAPLSTPQLNETVKITDTIAIKPTEIH